MKVAAFLSGGMDSIYACYDRLVNSEDQVTAVFFDFTEILGDRTAGCVQFKPVIEVQKKIVFSVVSWLSKNIRPIETIIVPINECRYKGWWSTEVVLWAVDRCNEGVFDQVINGWGGENINYLRAKVMFHLQKKMFQMFAHRGELLYPLDNITKLEIVKKLPKVLQDASLSCGSPVLQDDRIFICGKCNKCERQKYFEELIQKDIPEHQKKAMYQQQVLMLLGMKRTYQEMHPDFELWHLMEGF